VPRSGDALGGRRPGDHRVCCETEASRGGRNRASAHPLSASPVGSPIVAPFDPPRKVLNSSPETSRARSKSPLYPGNAGKDIFPAEVTLNREANEPARSDRTNPRGEGAGEPLSGLEPQPARQRTIAAAAITSPSALGTAPIADLAAAATLLRRRRSTIRCPGPIKSSPRHGAFPSPAYFW
jgi:hypothetical protein